MTFYLTINDQPSGVYWSQVTDVVDLLDRDKRYDVRLLALVSARGYRSIRKQIRSRCPRAIVLPMYPKMQNWQKNGSIVRWACGMYKAGSIMARGAFATAVALEAKKRGVVQKVCFDARGAYAAEWNEYRIIDDQNLIDSVKGVEENAVSHSDIRLAVSQALVDHWKTEYDYRSEEHVIVPCTLGADHSETKGGAEVRKALGVAEDDKLLVYSGSTAGWQSFDLLKKLLEPALTADPKLKVLFLSRQDTNNEALRNQFPGQVFVKWLNAAEVGDHLSACDLGMLVREDTVTNQVSSPTKFAEYLNAGLNVLISPRIGDMSAFVEAHGCGQVIHDEIGQLIVPNDQERARNRGLAKQHFSKEAFSREYARIMEVIGA